MAEQANRHFDILVLGGGVAGCAAALSAARLGKKVALIEKTVALGGLATNGQINLFVAMCNGYGKQITRGMAEEFFRLSIRHGFGAGAPEFVNGEIPEKLRKAYAEQGRKLPRYTTVFSMGIFSLELLKLLHDSGVAVFFDTLFTGLETEKTPAGTRVLGIYVETKSGRSYLSADCFVDASGDADLVFRAGGPTKKRGAYHFYAAVSTDMERLRKAVEANDIGKVFADVRGGKVDLFGEGPEEDLAVPLYDATDGDEINRYLISNQLQLLANHVASLEASGDENARKKRDIIALPAMVQTRTSRRIDGESTITLEDAYRHMNDSVATISDFHIRGNLYEISYGTLYNRALSNVLAAGRIISAEGYAWDFTRVIPPAILTGQAAGTAASLSVDAACPVSAVNVPKLQAILKASDVLIHFDDADIPADRAAVLEKGGEIG